MGTKSDLENCNCNEVKVDLIKKIIDTNCDELNFTKKNVYLNFENLGWKDSERNKVLLSGDIFKSFPINLFRSPDTTRLPKETAEDFITEFDRNFKEYLRPIRIHAKHIEKWYDSENEEMKVYIAENGGHIILYVKNDNNEYYQISDTLNQNNIITDDISDFSRQYEENLGLQLDDYIKNKRKADTYKNTRRFEIGKLIYEELQNLADTTHVCVLCIPSIIMDDIDVDYKYRLTFILAIGDYRINNSVYKILVEDMLYDRNGLCPPPDNSNC